MDFALRFSKFTPAISNYWFGVLLVQDTQKGTKDQENLVKTSSLVSLIVEGVIPGWNNIF